MFDCHLCFLQCLRAVAQDSTNATQALLRQPALTIAGLPRRSYVTAVARKSTYEFQNVRDAETRRPWQQGDTISKQDQKAVAALKSDPSKKVVDPEERRLRKELQYLTDPLKLADHIRHTLRTNDEEKALALVRLSSREMQCTVSWNHVIDWQMARGKANSALKTYNEMKKRAQFPDSHTYLLLLRGLAHPPVHSQSVGKALSIYHSMSAANAKVAPSIIHTNAVLKVCARANDMDSLWGVASRIPETGPGSADNLTYTTILNAIRLNALADAVKDATEEQIASQRDKAVVDGRRMWEEIISKWRRADILIDEELVCAMGRLLLIGTRPRDWDDVLSLVEQTMDIPRQIPRLGTSTRSSSHIPHVRASNSPDSLKDSPSDDGYEPVALRAGGEFNTLKTSTNFIGNSKKSSMVYVRPGNNTLSLILEACLKTLAKQPAAGYWALLTDPTTYAVKPDLDNLTMNLRLLRQSRSSADALKLLRDEFGDIGAALPHKVFRIAMAACVRDKKNPNVMQYANGLLDLMQNKLEDPDTKTLVQYLELALSSDSGTVILRALKRVQPSVASLRSLVTYGSVAQNQSTHSTYVPASQTSVSRNTRDDVHLLFRTMIGAYDRLLNKGEVMREEYEHYHQLRSKLAAFVTRMDERSAKREEKGDTPRWDIERRTERRKESRQLRHFWRNDVRRKKKEEGTWIEKRPEGRKTDKRDSNREEHSVKRENKETLGQVRISTRQTNESIADLEPVT